MPRKGSHAARRIQDEIDRRLYDLSLTLAPDKTTIQRWDAALEDSEDAQAELERLKGARKDEAAQLRAEMLTWTIYPFAEAEPIDPEELDREPVVQEYAELLVALGERDLPSKCQSRIRATLRELSALKLPQELTRVPELLVRAPELTADALAYVTTVARKARLTAFSVFEQLIDVDRFIREFEKLRVCQAALAHTSSIHGITRTKIVKVGTRRRATAARARALLAWARTATKLTSGRRTSTWRVLLVHGSPTRLSPSRRRRRRGRNKRFAEWGQQRRVYGPPHCEERSRLSIHWPSA